MTDSIKIITDHKWKNFAYRYEVPEKVLKSDFDWLDDGEGIDQFLCYRGVWYHLNQFMIWSSKTALYDVLGWEGYIADSYFSGILIRISSDGEQYQVATYIA